MEIVKIKGNSHIFYYSNDRCLINLTIMHPHLLDRQRKIDNYK